MDLSNKLVKDFAKQIIDTTSEERENSITVIGTVTSVSEDGKTANVLIDGNTVETPVISTVDLFVDDRVNVMIKNRTATVTNNYTHSNVDSYSGNISTIGNVLLPSMEDPPEDHGPEWVYINGEWYRYVPMVTVSGEADTDKHSAYAEISFLDGSAKLSSEWKEALDWDPDRSFATLEAYDLHLKATDNFDVNSYSGALKMYNPTTMGFAPPNHVDLTVEPFDDRENPPGEILMYSGPNYKNISTGYKPVDGTLYEEIVPSSITTIDLNADVVNVNGQPITGINPFKYDFSLTSHTKTGITINSGAMDEGTFTVSKAGYYPYAIGGFLLGNGSGSGSSYAIFNNMRLTGRTTGSATANWRIRAYGGKINNCTIYVDVLWIKESEIKPSESTPGDPSNPVIPSYTNVAPYIGDDGYWYTYDVGSGSYINTEVKAVVVEEDPTVYDWAKAETKPTYTESEIGISVIETQEIDDMFELLF